MNLLFTVKRIETKTSHGILISGELSEGILKLGDTISIHRQLRGAIHSTKIDLIFNDGKQIEQFNANTYLI